ncbi:MAG: hypothetical protein PWQ17_2500 [Anaerophaga sp.]|nr:hypothetical protein [Anaerophaga sp.]MDN5290458.1 hypothetical protein [Anaerophaga sp.]
MSDKGTVNAQKTKLETRKLETRKPETRNSPSLLIQEARNQLMKKISKRHE